MPQLSTIGFIILSHGHPEQVLRLVKTLNAMYEHPPIVCHHDMVQCPLYTHTFPANVRFVEPSIRTGWGKWSVVAAALAALELIQAEAVPEWTVLLSGSDYPVCPAAHVLAELSESMCDAFIDVHVDDPQHASSANMVGDTNPGLRFLDGQNSRSQKFRFYRAQQVWLPIVRRKPHWRFGRRTWYLPFSGRVPYGDGQRLYWGEHWFTCNRRAASVLLHKTSARERLIRHLRRRTSPDESFYQTMLANEPGLVLNRDNRRYVEWHGGGAHPKTLGAEDVPNVLASGAHFARKFEPDAVAIDMIDDALGLPSLRKRFDRLSSQ